MRYFDPSNSTKCNQVVNPIVNPFFKAISSLKLRGVCMFAYSPPVAWLSHQPLRLGGCNLSFCLRLVVNEAPSEVLIAWLSHQPLGLGGCNLSFFLKAILSLFKSTITTCRGTHTKSELFLEMSRNSSVNRDKDDADESGSCYMYRSRLDDDEPGDDVPTQACT
jgi:hypothetical protein